MIKDEVFGFILLSTIILWLLSLLIIGRVRSDRCLFLALTHMNDAIITTDIYGVITDFNAIAHKLTGWTAKQAIGKQALEILKMVNYETRIVLESPVSNVLHTGKAIAGDKNTLLIARDGSERPVETNAAPIRGLRGRFKGVIFIIRDITERYNVQQNLLESEERLKAVTNEVRIGLVMINRDRRYVYANSFYLQMLGISNTSVLGKRVEEILPLMYERIRPHLDKAFLGERVSYEVKGINNKEYNLNRIYSVTYEPQKRMGLVMHVVILVLDITDIRNPQKEP